MVTNEIKDSLRQTLEELRIAENELNRPVEDVVTLTLCVTARKSMGKMMNLYLQSKLKPHFNEESLQGLLEQCKKSHSVFESVSLDKIYCNGLNHSQCEDKHCLHYENVEECMSVAKKLKHIILHELNLNENDLV